jgi:hypothetical protein
MSGSGRMTKGAIKRENDSEDNNYGGTEGKLLRKGRKEMFDERFAEPFEDAIKHRNASRQLFETRLFFFSIWCLPHWSLPGASEHEGKSVTIESRQKTGSDITYGSTRTICNKSTSFNGQCGAAIDCFVFWCLNLMIRLSRETENDKSSYQPAKKALLASYRLAV